VDDLRTGRVRHVHRVQPHARPGRSEAAEHLAAVDLPTALHALGRSRREQDRKIVACLGVTGGEDLAREVGQASLLARHFLERHT
jgi:hypothetical protein